MEQTVSGDKDNKLATDNTKKCFPCYMCKHDIFRTIEGHDFQNSALK